VLSSKIISETQVLSLLRYHELLQELRKVWYVKIFNGTVRKQI
jgi:hypothetical protein